MFNMGHRMEVYVAPERAQEVIDITRRSVLKRRLSVLLKKPTRTDSLSNRNTDISNIDTNSQKYRYEWYLPSRLSFFMKL